MSNTPQSPFPNHAPVEALLEHRTWVRNLARSLVRDENAVDDLEQQTWMAAMRKPPQGAPKAWLGAVVRNLASKSRRTGGRRAAREERAARPEQIRSTAAVVAEAEVHERVVRAVLRLTEPYRSTLLLRFFEGLPPREIALRMEAPVETVRARVRRGLERIRESFDTEHGSRKSWCLLLAPLARPNVGTTSTASLGLGAILMGTKIKIAAAIAAAVLLGVFFFANPFEGDGSQDDNNVVADNDDLEQQPELTGTPGDAPKVQPVPEPAPEPVIAGARVYVVRGDVSVAKAAVRLVAKNDDSFELITNQRGRAALPADVSGPLVAFVVAEDGAMQRFGPMAFGPEETELRLTDGPPINVRFKDVDGKLFSAAEINRRFEELKAPRTVKLVSNALFNGSNLLEARLRDSANWTVDVTLSADGSMLRPMPRPVEGTWRLLTSRPGSTPFMSEPFMLEGEDEISVDVIMESRPKSVKVRVIDDETEEPMTNARIYAVYEYGDDAVFIKEDGRSVDAYGQIDLPLFSNVTAAFQRPPTWWVETETHACMLQNSTLAMAGESHVVRCQRRFDVKGTAYLRDGSPAAGRKVMAMLSKHPARVTTVAEDGTFALAGLPSRTLRGTMHKTKVQIVLFEDPDTLQVQMGKAYGSPGAIVELQIGEPGTGQQTTSVRGRITAGGTPLVGVMLMAKTIDGDNQLAKTDADGRFDIGGLKPGVLNMGILCGDPRASDDYIMDMSGKDAPHVLRLGAPTEVNLDLPGGFIEVTIVDDKTGDPLSGTAVAVEAMKREIDTERFPGFRYTPGWAELTNDKGVALLKAVPDGPVRVRVYSRSHGESELTDQTAGTAEEPAKVTIRLK